MLNLTELDSMLLEGGVLLLPNHHGAQQWQDQLGRWRCSQQHSSVVTAPAIHAIDLWLAQLWEQLGLHCPDPELGWRLLTPAEEELLLQDHLRQFTAGQLLNTAGTARFLREANSLLQLWQLTPADLKRHLPREDHDADQQPDPVLAWHWLQEFHDRCAAQHWLHSSARLAVMLKLLRKHPGIATPLLPPLIVWLGFDDPPPLYRELQAVLAGLGVELRHANHTIDVRSVRVNSFPDTAAELRAAARWCAETLEQIPAAHIGIICPNLHSLQPTLWRIFRQHLRDEDLYCSATASLSDQAFFHTAMQSLLLADTTCDSLSLCQWLRSPWLCESAAEANGRSALELLLRKQGELQTSTARLRELSAQEDKPWHSPALAQALLQLQTQLLRYKLPQSLAAWLQLFRPCWQSLLDFPQLGHPVHRSLQEAWQRWLDHVQVSSSLFGNIGREQALVIMSALARSCALPNSRSNAAVRVLTPVETAGLNFTHVWVLQLNAETWPGEPNPNPCLPLAMQRQQLMPAADAKNELARARAQLQRWSESCAEYAVLSYPRQLDDLPAEPSPLLRTWPEQVIVDTSLPADLHPALAEFPRNQLVLAQEVSLLPSAQDALSGPGSLLTAQAQCPFKAFALHRLGAKELRSFTLGLPASKVGELLHNILQEFWGVVKVSSALQQDAAILQGHLHTAVNNALRQAALQYPYTLTPRFRQLEAQRLLALCTRWLDIERQRRPFQVLDTEAEVAWQCDRLQLNLRLDRIDQTDNGLAVVDYKTGKLASADWQSLRPRETQLLLYQAALQQHRHEPVTAVLYARLSLEALEYKGVSAQDEGFAKLVYRDPDGNSDWIRLQQHWQQVLEGLAQEYLQGLVQVAPQFSTSCNHCHLHSLCRIDELRNQPETQR